MEATLEQPHPSARPRPIAPAWHTLVFVGIVLTLAFRGAVFQGAVRSHPGAAAPSPPHVLLYLWLLVLEWGLLYFVWRGVRGTGTRIADLVGKRWERPRDVLRDVGLAALAWAVFTAIAIAWMRYVPSDRAASVASFLPHGPLEIGLAVLVAISAGICEEITFRGYLQRQFEAWTGHFGVALVLQSLVFGVGHGYQGVKACGLIAIFGIQFGLLARWRGSLRPGIVGHALTDLLAGLFGI